MIYRRDLCRTSQNDAVQWMWRRRWRRLGLLEAASCVSSDGFWQSRIIGSAVISTLLYALAGFFVLFIR